jgi:hypothetical protein
MNGSWVGGTTGGETRDVWRPDDSTPGARGRQRRGDDASAGGRARLGGRVAVPSPTMETMTTAPAVPTTRVKVCGPLSHAIFPEACARCGVPARGTLPVEKMFRHTHSDSPTTYEFARVHVPFCDGCRAEHARLLEPVDRAALRKLRWTFVARCLPYVIPIGVLLYMIPKVLIPIARSLRDDSSPWGALIGLGLLAFFGVSLLGFLHLVSQARQNLQGAYRSPDPNDTYIRTVPILLGGTAVFPEPPTPVLAAADYTTDVAELFEGERHTFTFADPVFAAQFAALNADRLWDGKSPKARRARSLRQVVIVAVLALGAYMIVMDWLRS